MNVVKFLNVSSSSRTAFDVVRCKLLETSLAAKVRFSQ